MRLSALVMFVGIGGLVACDARTGAYEDPCLTPGTICRVAGWGNGTNGFNAEGALADQSLLYYPSALAVMPDGRLVIDDFNNMRIRVLERDGTLTDIAGNGVHDFSVEAPATETPLENPIDVSVASDGTLYIAELHASRILRVDLEGNLTWFAGTGDVGYVGDGGPATEAHLANASGVAVLDDGSVYVADSENHCLRRIGPDGVIGTVAGGGVPGYAGDGETGGVLMNNPQRVRPAPDGTLLVADFGNNVIRRVDPETNLVWTVVGNGEAGYAGDGGPATEASLSGPTAAWESPEGVIYVADSNNNVVRRVDPDGTIETIAGTGEPGLDGDFGDARDAHLNYPADVVVGPEGLLYVADLKNGMVRSVALDGNAW